MKYNSKAYNPPAPVLVVSVVNFATPARTVNDQPALLDTGADITALPQDMVDELALKPKGEADVGGFRQGSSEKRPTFWVRIVAGEHEVVLDEVVGDDCAEILLGRDFLNRFLVVLDGPRGDFSIRPPESIKRARQGGRPS